jgi:AcrR family transcriptional regulator
MARPKSGDKRAAILAAAAETIAARGTSASTANIARAAGVAEGSLFRYFADKETLLNELYRDMKLEMRDGMIAGFPATAGLKRRAQHIWDAYVSWGVRSPVKRSAMAQLTISELITHESRRRGEEGFAPAKAAMSQLLARGRLHMLSQSFISALLLSMAETTMTAMEAEPRKAGRYREAGFEAFWSATGK